MSFYFILQNNSKITILTFMNVDGAFILAETRRKTSVLLFVDNSMQISHYEFGKMFVTCITLSHAFKNNNNNEQMMSNSVSVQNFLTLWTLNPGAVSSCSAV